MSFICLWIKNLKKNTIKKQAQKINTVASNFYKMQDRIWCSNLSYLPFHRNYFSLDFRAGIKKKIIRLQ